MSTQPQVALHVAKRRLARIRRVSATCAVAGLIGIGGMAVGEVTHNHQLVTDGMVVMYSSWAALALPIGSAENRAKADVRRLGTTDTTVSGP